MYASGLDTVVQQIKLLSSAEVQHFVRNNEYADEHKLLLRNEPIYGLSPKVIAYQIIGRRKSKSKLPTFYRTAGIVYPNPLNLEQSSSELASQFKLKWLAKIGISFDSVVDLTGGFGIDSFYFAQGFDRVLYFERNLELSEIARHNFRLLRANNIEVVGGNSETHLASIPSNQSLIYVDPSRRVDSKRVHAFSDCEPNVLELVDRSTAPFLIKASPMLDIKAAISELGGVSRLSVLSINNDCKEILFLVNKSERFQNPQVDAYNITANIEDVFSFEFGDQEANSVEFSEPLQFIFEPNASIMKAGAFKTVATRFGLKKLHPSTQLYTSSELCEGFPGRVFSILSEIRSSEKSAREHLGATQANIFVRNYPLSVEELKRKLKLSDGGTSYLLGTMSVKGKHLLAMTRIN